MIIIIKIADGYELAVAKFNGLSFPENNPPSNEEALSAIETLIYERMINPAYENIVKESPTVKAKEAELEAAKEDERTKFEDAKALGK